MIGVCEKCLYDGVIVPTALYEAEAWGMGNTERRKVNVLEIKVWLECHEWTELGMRRCIERELKSRTDEIALRWFGHLERKDEYHMVRRVLMAEVTGRRV